MAARCNGMLRRRDNTTKPANQLSPDEWCCPSRTGKKEQSKSKEIQTQNSSSAWKVLHKQLPADHQSTVDILRETVACVRHQRQSSWSVKMLFNWLNLWKICVKTTKNPSWLGWHFEEFRDTGHQFVLFLCMLLNPDIYTPLISNKHLLLYNQVTFVIRTVSILIRSKPHKNPPV